MSLAKPERLAVVQDGGRITRYVRAGSGSPLLVLWDQSDQAFQSSIPVLATAFRVIAPQIPAGAIHTEQLAAFVEGVGLAGVRVLASADFSDQVMALAERGGWGDVVRSATMLTRGEDLEAAAQLLCATQGEL